MNVPLIRAVPTVCLVLAAAVAGVLFGPVFGVPALLLPVGVPAAAVLLTALACAPREPLVAWRPLLLALAGLLGVTETLLWPTTVAGLPTARTLRALAAGATDSWRLALQSTWPARPDPALLLFVPLLVVLAGVLGVELLHRLGNPLLALAPSFAVLVLSQCYTALAPGPAAVAALGYAAVAGCLLAAIRTDPGGEGRPVSRRHVVSALLRAAPPAVLAVLGLVLAGLLPLATQPRYALQRDQPAPLPQTSLTNPLDDIAYRLAHPGTAVFRVRGRDASSVDRWPLVVLDEFDGVNWTSSGLPRRLGTELRQTPAVTVPVSARSAEIDAAGVGGPWLPSQTWPVRVRDAAPMVVEQHGTLLLPGPGGAARYTLTWRQPEIDADVLDGAAIDPAAPGGLNGVGVVPERVAVLAEQAVGGLRPSFQAALALERFFRENYRGAVGEDLPAGHAWPQLEAFLLRDRRGTSEQLAAAYVAMARILGIPARLAVGFRAPADYSVDSADGWATVRNGDVLAWPEVAVSGIGWVPLDPERTGTAGGSAPRDPVAHGGLAAAAEQARAQLPAAEDLRDPPVAPQQRAGSPGGTGGAAGSMPWTIVFGGLVLLVIAGRLLGVPGAKVGRAWRRRHRAGAGAVVGAWEETRDRLRAHGVAVSAGMTVRELATAAAAVVDATTVDGIRRLGTIVDQVLWSESAPAERSRREAWAAVRMVRRGLARRGWRARLRALLDLHSLLPQHR